MDRTRVLEAFSTTAGRVAGLIGSIADPGAPTRGLEWTLGETAAHMVSDVRLHRQWLRGEGTIDYGVPDLAARNRRNLDEMGVLEPARLAALLREEAEAFAREGAEQPVGATVPAEVGRALTVEEISAVLLGELLVHGFDLARTLGRKWPIGRAEANLVAAGSVAILPQFVDPVGARGANVSYDLRLRDGPRVLIRVQDGEMSVEPTPRGASVDSVISADPAAFLLVGYGRVGQWGPILRGQMVAWGRRPWTAFRFKSYLRNP